MSSLAGIGVAVGNNNPVLLPQGLSGNPLTDLITRARDGDALNAGSALRMLDGLNGGSRSTTDAQVSNGASAGAAAAAPTVNAPLSSAQIDALVLQAHRDGGFAGQPQFHYGHRTGLEQIFYVYSDGSTQDAQVRQTQTTCNGNDIVRAEATVAPDRNRTLVAVVHTHQNRAPGDFAARSYPGPGDGFIPATRDMPNYQLASGDVFVVRPDAAVGVGAIEHLQGSSSFPRSAENDLRRNAAISNNPPQTQVRPSVCPR